MSIETKLEMKRAAWFCTDAGWSVERREGDDRLYVYWTGVPTVLIPSDDDSLGVPEDAAHALAVAIMAALNVNLETPDAEAP